MKFRKDFVTNSSSSSFVCEICGKTEGGWDISLDEAEMFECENGHILCQEHMIDVPREEMIEQILKIEYWDNKKKENFHFTQDELEKKDDDELFHLLGDGCLYEMPECFCPICQFDEYSDDDMAAYLLKKYGLPKEDCFAIIKAKNKRRKKLYNSEYIAYVAQKLNLDIGDVPGQWKEQFRNYAEFSAWLGMR